MGECDSPILMAGVLFLCVYFAMRMMGVSIYIERDCTHALHCMCAGAGLRFCVYACAFESAVTVFFVSVSS